MLMFVYFAFIGLLILSFQISAAHKKFAYFKPLKIEKIV